MTHYILKDFTVHPYWNKEIYIPMLKLSFTPEINGDTLSFNHHGIQYFMDLNSAGRALHSGAIMVQLTRRNKYRTLRKPIGLPNHVAIVFTTYSGKPLNIRALDTKRVWDMAHPNSSMAHAFKHATG